MTSEEHKSIVRSFFKAFVSNDQATLIELMAPEFEFQVAGMPGPVDRETQLQGFAGLHMAFSGIQLTIEDQIAEGDKVATRLTWQATHTGDFQGLALTGKQFSISAISIERIKDSKIIERWYEQDDLSLLQQLGAFPPGQPNN